MPALHRAAADGVLPLRDQDGAYDHRSVQWNEIRMVVEGFDVFGVPVPAAVAGGALEDSGIRERTGYRVVALRAGQNGRVVPNPDFALPEGAAIVLIGTAEAEEDPRCPCSMRSGSTASACSSWGAPLEWAPPPPNWRSMPAPKSS